MADFVVPRHSAVMERLRRRIELCRRHHSACESRYQAVSPERLELERQQTFALHQRCLQAKAKRAGKHRQPAPAAPPPAAPSQPPSSAPSAGSAATSASSDRPGANGLDSDTAGGEQQQQQQQQQHPGRSSALIASQVLFQVLNYFQITSIVLLMNFLPELKLDYKDYYL
uniref:Uncharacterized protein n=1 Tax=Sphaerodactylus townsendi TaxID=933632 RepID=A0ACB8EJW6_9SAUR